MATFTTLTSSDLDPDSPVTTNLANAWYDNPLAIAQGDATVANANRIDPKAIKDSTAGDYLQIEAQTNITEATYTKEIEFYVPRAGQVTVKSNVRWSKSSATGTHTCYGRVYVNGVANGAEFTASGSGTFATTDQDIDISVSAGDLVQLYCYWDGDGTNISSRLCESGIYVDNPLNYCGGAA